MLAHAQTAFLPMLQTVGAIQGKLELAPRVRQLAILRVAQRDGCEYELVQHEVISRIEACPRSRSRPSGWPRDRRGVRPDRHPRAAVHFDEVLDQIEASESTFAAMTERFSAREIVELLVVIGQYHRDGHAAALDGARAPAAGSTPRRSAAPPGAQRWRTEPSWLRS